MFWFPIVEVLHFSSFKIATLRVGRDKPPNGDDAPLGEEEEKDPNLIPPDFIPKKGACTTRLRERSTLLA